MEIPLWVWVVFVLGVDVGHVWGSIFRTYLDKEEFALHRKAFIYIPMVSFLAVFLIVLISVSLFWTVLAYLAVFHFIKQQYGFMQIYKAKNQDFKPRLIRDDWLIYIAMIYPLIFWHFNTDRNFAWFVIGDFLQVEGFDTQFFNQIGNFAYLILLLGWLVQETIFHEFILSKVLWVLTTAGNWFLGIVFFNSDLVFTITNVVAHGIPYLALVIIYQQRKYLYKNLTLKSTYPIIVITVILLLAYWEEWFWDLFVYREHTSIFPLELYKWVNPTQIVQAAMIALLSVPQITHYFIDGFIWRSNSQNPYIKKVLLAD